MRAIKAIIWSFNASLVAKKNYNDGGKWWGRSLDSSLRYILTATKLLTAHSFSLLISLTIHSFMSFWIFTEETFKIHAQSYVTASASVTNYLDNLFLSKNLGIDWWRFCKLTWPRPILYTMHGIPSWSLFYTLSSISINLCNKLLLLITLQSKSWTITRTVLVWFKIFKSVRGLLLVIFLISWN